MSIACEVKSITPIAPFIYRVLLKPSTSITFKAGQYLLAIMGDSDKRPFSIASAPCRKGEIELHIGAADHNHYTLSVVDAMASAKALNQPFYIEAPEGAAWLREETQKPLILVAGGTGFSYINSILERCVSLSLSQPIYVYWGARHPEQLYDHAHLMDLTQSNGNIHYIPVVESTDGEWSGRMGNVLDAVCGDFESLAEKDIYLCGRFEMAKAARTRFHDEKQANVDRMYADAFSF
jgi:aquacobalamin reductase/NAD(P)H-flavin reductase